MSLLKDEAIKLRAEMDAEGLFDVVAALEAHIAGYNKELWFLRSMMA